MSAKHRLLLGAHMLITKGLAHSFVLGESIGCTCMQIFSKSPRQWKTKPLTKEEISLFIAAKKKSSIDPVMVHASYLINIGSSSKTTAHRAIQALIQELQRCIELTIPYLVLHSGSAGTGSVEDCLSTISKNLDIALEQCPGKTKILLENTAGQGSSVGHSFEQLAAMRSAAKHKKRIGFCIDTCHAFAAGYDFRTPKTYDAMWKEFDKIIGLEYLEALHINDSLKDLGSHIDRHVDIGKGKLGLEPFKLIFNDPKFFDIPKILETPHDSIADDARNMHTIFTLLSPATKRILKVKQEKRI
jgi:deoxyribonuclease IV